MVVLSVAIVSGGKTLVARQFVEMTRLRVEGLLSAFPKLIDSSRDHTFIETETVRYVYQPMESTYLVLVTNRSSNILEDLETLRLLAKVVQDCLQPMTVCEELIIKHAFDIVFAFDEVISFGHRESVTLSQIKTYCEMDSHEEKLHQMIEQSKINEAREMAKKRQHELAVLRASQPAAASTFNSGPSTSISSSSMQETMSSTPTVQDIPAASWSNSMADDSGPAPLKPGAPKKGMMLSKKKPGDIFGGSFPGGAPAAAEEETTAAQVQEAAPAAPAFNPLADPVKVEISEVVNAKMEVEGGLVGEVEIVGDFKVTVLDASKADLVCFKLSPQDQSFKYKVHPNLNKSSHAQNILEVRDASKAYRANVEAPLLKWRLTSTNEDYLPVALSFFSSQTPDGTQINLEYELTDNSICLEDIHIIFSCPPSGRPQIASAEPGEAVYDTGNQQVHWHIPTISKTEGDTGTLEFTAAADLASLIPYQFEAVRREATKCPMDILECYHQERKDAIPYALQKTCRYSFVVGA